MKRNIFVVLTILLATVVFPGLTEAFVVGSNSQAYFDNPYLVGLGAQGVNFAATHATPQPDLSEEGLVGQAWSSGAGWIQFSGTNYSVGLTCSGDTATGELNGYAWGEGTGWINFSPTNGGVQLDSEGYLDGRAWAQSVGWLIFDKTQCPGGLGCVQFDFACTRDSSSGTSSGSVHYVCKDPEALNYNEFGRHNQSLCRYDGGSVATSQDLVSALNEQGATCPYFTTYEAFGSTSREVALIQTFLKKLGFYTGQVDSIYGPLTDNGIRGFQAAYALKVLTPWGLTTPTGRWYQTTRHTANELAGCSEGTLELDNGVVVK